MKYISIDYLLKHQQRYERNDYGDTYSVACVPIEVIMNSDDKNIIDIKENKTTIVSKYKYLEIAKEKILKSNTP